MTIGPYQRQLAEFPNGNLGPAITLDFHVNGIYQSGVLNNANCVLTFLPPRVHSTIWLEFIQDATGGRTVTFPGAVVGPFPPLNSAPNASTIIEMLWNGTNYQFTSPSAVGFINVSAGSTSNNLPAITFSNSNGLSFGLSGSVITGSYSVPTQTSLSYSNSNGISFGIAGSTLTASYTVPSTTGLISGMNISAGTNSANLSSLVFSNSNNFSFGLSGSTITGSVAAAALQTNQTIGLYGLGNTTQNSSTTLDARTLSFNGLGGNTVGYSNGSIQISGVTTNGLISKINVSAGTTSNNLSAITFSNSNGLSFGLNGSTITGSYTVPSTAGLLSAVNVSAGTTSSNVSNFVFSNSNGVSFGLNGSTITGSVAVVAQTNQTIGLYALGNTTQNSSTTLDARTLSFNGLGANTVGYSNGSIQISAPVVSSLSATGAVSISSNGNTISIGAPAMSSLSATGVISISSNGNTISIGAPVQSVNFSAGTTSNNFTNIVFSNSNGVSFGLNGSTITGSVGAAVGQTNQTIGLYALGNTTQNSSTTLDARTLSFNGLGIITAGYSNGSIQISATQSNQTANIVVPTAGTQTATSGTVAWSNSNNITFGMSGSSRITASYNFSISGGTSSGFGNGMTFTNSNNMSFTNNAGVIQANATPHTADVVNDSNVSGANVNIALNNLLLEFPDGNYTEAVSFTLAGSKLGKLGLITAASITCTIPTHATDPTLITGSRFSFINYGGNVIFSAAGGVTIHGPTGYPTQNYCRFDCFIVAVDEWIITWVMVNIGTDNIANNSSVSGASDSAALNQLQLQSFHGTLMIPLTITTGLGDGTPFSFSLINGNFDSGPGNYFVGMIGPLPSGVSINSVTLTYQPQSGHGANFPPAFMPNMEVYSQFNGAVNSLGTATDTSANATAYELVHSITTSFSNQVASGTSFWFYFLSESGTHALAGLELICASVNVV